MTKENLNKEELLKNVVLSTENALMALTHLEQNLIKGRFKEGIKPYEAMINTLIGQRIWSSDKNDSRINNNLKKIAATAQNLIDILQPYVENLEKLTSIDGEIILENAESEIEINSIDAENIGNKDMNKVIQIIEESPKQQISYTRLRSELGWEKERLDKILSTMAESGIKTSHVGSRKLVSVDR